MIDKKINYVGAAYAAGGRNQVLVWERGEDGVRRMKAYPPPLYFYVPADDGEHTTIFGNKVTRMDFSNQDEFESAAKQFKNATGTLFESDFSPLHRVLMDLYYGREVPIPWYCFIDIEVNYSKEIGFASPANPYAPISAITVYQSWSGKYITIATPPEGWDGSLPTLQDFQELNFNVTPDIKIVADERALLLAFLDAIEESDYMSGWNSDFFDIPYIYKRIEAVCGLQALSRLGFIGAYPPKAKMVPRFGTEELTYQIFGRNHLDYLRLFKKFTFEGRPSYTLGAIAEDELDIPKLSYDGTLSDLYHFNFKRFLLYNIRDVEILHRLNLKFKFIELVNQMCHENTVLPAAILGTVSYVETGIANYAHNVKGLIVNDKTIDADHEKIEGAIVLTQKAGLHEWPAGIDVQSLYPTCIMLANMSPEKIVGQFVGKEQDWRGIFRDQDDKIHIFVDESGREHTLPGSDWRVILQENKWCVSAYGTVFDESEGRGLVAEVISFWFSERKRLQAEKKKWTKVRKDLKKDSPEWVEAKKQEDYYDMLQLTKKIQLNSTYGALLNVAFRFGDERLGASVTAIGRQITTHIMETVSELATGTRTPLIKTTVVDKKGKVEHIYTSDSPAILGGDTDSCYFKTFGADREDAVKRADEINAKLNSTFVDFLRTNFNCQPGFDSLIKVNREIVGRRGLFYPAKKKYVIRVVDKEGNETDELKVAGSEMKKADTPRRIQKFIEVVIKMLLNGDEYEKISSFVNDQRNELFKVTGVTDENDILKLGTVKAVNNLDNLYDEYLRLEKTGQRKVTLSGHARAAINYNEMAQQFEGKGAQTIHSGDKVAIFYLRPNEYGLKSIAFPSEMTRIPTWFNENFKIDIEITEQKLIDSKLEGIFKACGWEVPTPQLTLFNSVFKF